jgi:hypothetical protein
MAHRNIRREVEDAFKKPGECFLCNFEESLKERIGKYIDKIVTDPVTREKLSLNGFLCDAHVKEILIRMDQGSVDSLSAALAMKALIQTRLSEVEAQMSSLKIYPDKHDLSFVRRLKDLGSSARDAPASKWDLEHPCLVCELRLDELRNAVDAFIKALRTEDEGIVKPFKTSGGMCMPHYRMVLERLGLLPGSVRNIIARQLMEVQYRSLYGLNSCFYGFIDGDGNAGREGKADPSIILKGAERLAGRGSLGNTHRVAWSSINGSRNDALPMDRLGEIEKLTLERDRLRAHIADLSRRMSDLDTMYTGLRFRSNEYVEDNKALLIQISGLRGEVNLLRRSLERRGETPPTLESRSSDRENEMKERYLFFKRSTEANEEQNH